MQIFVKTLTSRTVALEVDSSETIKNVKQRIEEREGYELENVRSVCAGKDLTDESTLAECNVDNLSTIELLLRLAGGAKKRKKKNYSTPKKIKHKRKKVKLAVLKYYKVDENGKIHRLRRECPGDNCGAGVFMAAHEDRHYCGKCNLTLVFVKNEEK